METPITRDNIQLSEPNPSVIGWIRLRCPARTAYLFASSSAFAPKGIRFPPVSGHFHRGSVLPRCAMCGRLRVGKENLHVAGVGRCSHVFGLLARFA
jgi:hypothetical protein